MKWLLALNLVTFQAPGGQLITINPSDVVSLTKPRVQLEKSIECIINMSDGKHVPVIETCDEVRERLSNE
jgi:hypothetical protein